MAIADKLTQIAENTRYVYDSGYNSGFGDGYDKAIHDYGTQYDEFWDTFQQNGKRTYYSHAFRSSEWTEKILKPKYPMQPAYAAYMFYSCLYSGDLTDNVQLDFSKCTNFSYIFTYASLITHVGEMDTRSATELIAAFQFASGLITIDKIKLKDDGSQVVTNMFGGCSSLQNVVFEGKFGNNISFSDSTNLSRASIESVINALSDSTSGKTASFSHEAVGKAFNYDFGGSWSDFIATKPNWTISMV